MTTTAPDPKPVRPLANFLDADPEDLAAMANHYAPHTEYINPNDPRAKPPSKAAKPSPAAKGPKPKPATKTAPKAPGKGGKGAR